MEEFSSNLHRQTGLVLAPHQIMKLYTKYYDVDTKVIDYERFYADVLDKAIVDTKQALDKEDSSAFQDLIQKIYECVEKKLNYDLGKDRLKQVYRLLSESRSPVITRFQLKTACFTRLNFPLRETEVDIIFKKLDNLRVGSIRTRELIDVILSKSPPTEATLIIGAGNIVKLTPEPVGNETARITHDQKIVNLQAPDPANCLLYSVWDLENIVRVKITEQATGSHNMLKTARRMFGNGGHSSGDVQISRDQLRFTFWKVLRINVADRDLDRFFQKYQHGNVILLTDLMDGIIKKSAAEEPMLEDHTITHTTKVPEETKIHSSNSLDAFFTQLRNQINELVNRKSRAPHYLLHGTSKLTMAQTKLYFRKKLLFDIDQFSPDLITQVMRAYTNSSGLVDVKRIFLEAMATKDSPTDTAESVDIFPQSPLLKHISPPDVAESNRFVPIDDIKPTRPNLSFHEVGNNREHSSALSAAPDRHHSVEDLLEHLRLKRQALEAATYAPPSASRRPQTASSAATSRTTRASASPVVVNFHSPFEPTTGSSQARGRSSQGTRPSPRATSASRAIAEQHTEAPSGKTVGFFVPTFDLFSTPHAEFAITSAREGSQFAVTGARPTSAPAGTLYTGSRFGQSVHTRQGRSPGTLDDSGLHGVNVAKVSPRAPALSLAMPEPALFDEALHDIMQSSLQKALLELTVESPSSSPVHSPPGYVSPHSPLLSTRAVTDERARPISASATMRSRSASRGHSPARGISASRDISPSREFPSESASPLSFGGNTEPIVLITQVKQQPRVQRPSSAPSTHAVASPRVQKAQPTPSSLTAIQSDVAQTVVVSVVEPRVPMLNIPKPGSAHKNRPKHSARRSAYTEPPAHCHYVLDPSFVDAADSLAFPDTPKFTTRSPSPSSRTPNSARTTHTLDSSAFSMSARSPVYTGQPRHKYTDPTSFALSHKYNMYKNYNKTSNNEYGLFSNHFLKAVRKSNRLHEKQTRNRSPISVGHTG